MARKPHNNSSHHDRCEKPHDDSHEICPLKPIPGLEWVKQTRMVRIGSIRPTHKICYPAPGGREEHIVTADAAEALAAELLRVAALTRKANEP